MATPELTAEEQREAEHYAALLVQIAQRHASQFGELIASRPNHQLLGKTEFDLRDLVHRLAAEFLATALEERKKGATAGQVSAAPTANPTPT